MQLVQLVSFSVYSQCSDIIKIPYSDGSYGEYIGCLDDFGDSSGKGILKTDNYQKEGEWESGKLNGQGKFTFKSGVTVEVIFRNNIAMGDGFLTDLKGPK